MVSRVKTQNTPDQLTDQQQRRAENLGRLLRPRHIAYIGGSQISGALAMSQRAGFEGELWVVNPLRDEIGGLKCFANLNDLPEPPDATMIAMSPEKSIAVIQALAISGAGGAVCLADGFAEVGETGARLQQQLLAAAGDLAVIGPNCMGVLNLFEGAAIWGSGGHFKHPGGQGAAIISQSGAFLFGITNVEQGFPLGYAISTGNQAVIDMADCIEAVLADSRVRAIGLYLEGLDDGKSLGNACWQALQKGIPIVAIKGGDTAEAEKVAISHTSAMVVERDLWQAFSERYAITEVSTPKAMVETLKFLTIAGLPRGNRLAAISFSGGLNSLISAQAPTYGLKLQQPKATNVETLRARLPETIPITNPLDFNLPWNSKNGMSLQDGDDIADCLCTFASDVADMATLFLDVPAPNEQATDKDWYPSMEAMATVQKTLGIPCAVAGIMPEGLIPDLRKHLIDLDIAPLLGFSDAMEALANSARLGEKHRVKLDAIEPGDLLTDYRTDDRRARSIMLDEAESKLALQQYGLKTPDFVVTSADRASESAANIGFPVALKLISNTISHKAKIGGVKLGLDSREAVDEAVLAIKASARQMADLEIDAFLIESMVKDPQAEFIIGVKRQKALGLALMIGRGGIAVETMNCFATVLLPLVDSDVEIAMARVGLSQSDLGYATMRKAVNSIAAYALEHNQQLQSLDVNPLIVSKSGEAIATDALIVLTEEIE